MVVPAAEAAPRAKPSARVGAATAARGEDRGTAQRVERVHQLDAKQSLGAALYAGAQGTSSVGRHLDLHI